MSQKGVNIKKSIGKSGNLSDEKINSSLDASGSAVPEVSSHPCATIASASECVGSSLAAPTNGEDQMSDHDDGDRKGKKRNKDKRSGDDDEKDDDDNQSTVAVSQMQMDSVNSSDIQRIHNFNSESVNDYAVSFLLTSRSDDSIRSSTFYNGDGYPEDGEENLRPIRRNFNECHSPSGPSSVRDLAECGLDRIAVSPVIVSIPYFCETPPGARAIGNFTTINRRICEDVGVITLTIDLGQLRGLEPNHLFTVMAYLRESDDRLPEFREFPLGIKTVFGMTHDVIRSVGRLICHDRAPRHYDNLARTATTYNYIYDYGHVDLSYDTELATIRAVEIFNPAVAGYGTSSYVRSSLFDNPILVNLGRQTRRNAEGANAVFETNILLSPQVRAAVQYPAKLMVDRSIPIDRFSHAINLASGVTGVEAPERRHFRRLTRNDIMLSQMRQARVVYRLHLRDTEVWSRVEVKTPDLNAAITPQLCNLATGNMSRPLGEERSRGTDITEGMKGNIHSRLNSETLGIKIATIVAVTSNAEFLCIDPISFPDGDNEPPPEGVELLLQVILYLLFVPLTARHRQWYHTIYIAIVHLYFDWAESGFLEINNVNPNVRDYCRQVRAATGDNRRLWPMRPIPVLPDDVNHNGLWIALHPFINFTGTLSGHHQDCDHNENEELEVREAVEMITGNVGRVNVFIDDADSGQINTHINDLVTALIRNISGRRAGSLINLLRHMRNTLTNQITLDGDNLVVFTYREANALNMCERTEITNAYARDALPPNHLHHVPFVFDRRLSVRCPWFMSYGSMATVDIMRIPFIRGPAQINALRDITIRNFVFAKKCVEMLSALCVLIYTMRHSNNFGDLNNIVLPLTNRAWQRVLATFVSEWPATVSYIIRASTAQQDITTFIQTLPGRDVLRFVLSKDLGVLALTSSVLTGNHDVVARRVRYYQNPVHIEASTPDWYNMQVLEAAHYPPVGVFTPEEMRRINRDSSDPSARASRTFINERFNHHSMTLSFWLSISPSARSIIMRCCDGFDIVGLFFFDVVDHSREVTSICNAPQMSAVDYNIIDINIAQEDNVGIVFDPSNPPILIGRIHFFVMFYRQMGDTRHTPGYFCQRFLPYQMTAPVYFQEQTRLNNINIDDYNIESLTIPVTNCRNGNGLGLSLSQGPPGGGMKGLYRLDSLRP